MLPDKFFFDPRDGYQFDDNSYDALDLLRLTGNILSTGDFCRQPDNNSHSVFTPLIIIVFYPA